ncbi:MAG: LamG domain-containing protein [Planctomycetes bacterium]|nr:LamG domain-containing protein [Planctomycetota bacterium]
MGGIERAKLDRTGLKVGQGSASANLDISGNALISESLIVGGTSNPSSSNLHVHGTIAYSSQTLSSGTNLMPTSDSIIFADTSNGNVFIQMPDPSTIANQIFTIINTSDQNSLFISGMGNTIDNHSTLSFPSGDQPSLRIFYSGSQWYILNHSSSEDLKEAAGDNLTLWWPLSESSGNTASDSSSAANLNGLLTNEHLFSGNSISGISGQALKLDNRQDTILHAASANLDYNSYSYSLWAKYTTDSSESVDGSPDITGRAGFVWSSDNQFNHMAAYHQLSDDSYVSTNIQSTATLSANTWYHVAVTWSSTDSSLKLYLNGSLESGNVAASWKSGSNIMVTNPGIHAYSETLIDDVRLYNKAISADEVLATYYAGNPSAGETGSATAADLPPPILIVQGDGDDYVTFEAELGMIVSGYSIIDSSTSPAIPAGASEGKGLWEHGSTIGTSEATTSDGQAQPLLFAIQFATSGTYDLWVRRFVADNDATDGLDSGTISENTYEWGNDSFWVPDSLTTSSTYSGTFSQYNLSGSAESYEFDKTESYTVVAGETYLLHYGFREDGSVLDRFCFVDNGSATNTDAEIVALPNSEVIYPKGTIFRIE